VEGEAFFVVYNPKQKSVLKFRGKISAKFKRMLWDGFFG
jgi:hypothetical protein